VEAARGHAWNFFSMVVTGKRIEGDGRDVGLGRDKAAHLFF
jgi:hypothetical protein